MKQKKNTKIRHKNSINETKTITKLQRMHNNKNETDVIKFNNKISVHTQYAPIKPTRNDANRQLKYKKNTHICKKNI